MSYVKHNFQRGDELLASQLNEMDDQIAENENVTQTLVEVSNSEPTEDNNLIWIKETTTEVQVPTMSDIGNLNNLVTTAKNNLVAAINEVAQSGGGTGNLNQVLFTYLIPILQAGVYTSDQSDEIDDFISALQGGSGGSI